MCSEDSEVCDQPSHSGDTQAVIRENKKTSSQVSSESILNRLAPPISHVPLLKTQRCETSRRVIGTTHAVLFAANKKHGCATSLESPFPIGALR